MDALVDPDKLDRLYHRNMQETTVQPPHVQQIEERPQKGSVEMSVLRRSHPQHVEDEKNGQDDNADPEVFHDRILHGSISAKHRVNPMEQGGDLFWVPGSPSCRRKRENRSASEICETLRLFLPAWRTRVTSPVIPLGRFTPTPTIPC